jgi:hypothetical protein
MLLEKHVLHHLCEQPNKVSPEAGLDILLLYPGAP